jgi:hypothetical protein
MGGLFLVVLISQNLVYAGIPVRISGWLLLAAAMIPVWLGRRKFFARIRACCSDAEIRTLAVVILLTITFHGVVPIQQGLDRYYGKGHFDQINYVLLAEFLKEEPYGTSEQEIGLRPWLVGPVGFRKTTGEVGTSSGPGLETIGLKDERIGQSVLMAEIGVWSGTDGKGAYAATVIFFLTVLAISVYVFLRLIGTERLMAASGALLAACLPAVTRLSLDGFLSQVGIFFVFPFFACLLQQQTLTARSFTLFFSLTLAYLIAVYSEIAPIGVGTFFLGVLFVRRDNFRAKRLMLMSAILLIALMNPCYLGNLIQFLAYQYNLAAGAASLWENVAPNVLTLGGWSEIIFGTVSNPRFALFFDFCALLLGLLSLAGAVILCQRDRRIFGAVLLPALLLISYLATSNPPSYYPMAKIALTVLPFVIGLIFVTLSSLAAKNRNAAVLIKGLGAMIIAAAGAGSVRYYGEVLNNDGLLKIFREPRFLMVCRALEEIKNKRVLIFETHPLLDAWLCYHARHNEVYFDGRLISDAAVPPGLSFSKVPDLENIDLVATSDQLIDLRTTRLACLTSIDDTGGEILQEGHVRYDLGPPARLRFLALKAISANLRMRLTTGPAATTFPIDYFLTDAQGHVFHDKIQSKNLEVLRMNIPRGLSYLELSVKAKESGANPGRSFPILAELDGIEISDVDWNPGG